MAFPQHFHDLYAEGVLRRLPTYQYSQLAQVRTMGTGIVQVASVDGTIGTYFASSLWCIAESQVPRCRAAFPLEDNCIAYLNCEEPIDDNDLFHILKPLSPRIYAAPRDLLSSGSLASYLRYGMPNDIP